jgi:murein DD-endopeptidase MepM/ murein hydrolase activator NlpD
MGDSGRATGPNLHFEVLQNGRRVNPVNFIRESSD